MTIAKRNVALPPGSTAVRRRRRSISIRAVTVQDLPNEILAEVFMHAIADDRQKVFPKSEDSLRSRHDVLLNIMLTCRKWKAVALAAPRLWDTVYIRKETRILVIQRFIERSKAIDLKLYMRLKTARTLAVVSQYAPRLIELHLWLKKVDVHTVVESMDFAVPRLQRLTLHLSSVTVAAPGIELPRRFLSSISALRELRLSPYPGLVPRGHCTRLTRLCLSTGPCPATGGMSILDILDILEENPGLEELELGLKLYGAATEIVRLVQLPRLRLLSLREFMGDKLPVILAHIGLPEEAHCLICHAQGIWDNLSTSFPQDVSHLRNLQQVTRIQISYSEDAILQVIAASDRDRSSFWYDTGDAYDLEVYAQDSVHFSTLFTLPILFPAGQLSELWIAFPEYDQVLPAKKWQQILEPMQSLCALNVIQPKQEQLVEALAMRCGGGKRLCCQQLRHLGLSDRGSLQLRRVKKVLRQRREGSCPLTSLWLFSLDHPRVPAANIQLTEELGEFVHVRITVDDAWPTMRLPQIYEDRFIEEFDLEPLY
ncbi:hypothetical protein CERSUDRAFT_117376 [Gelatoporia subvermispora B]|uniref:F-box domain-containing protein n=1 Tax=Ceriporiopsis subvermispora (strain B) TaxID=914234 RepID=M2R7Y9_CERS8|nr:hypothetical protein CERSUDRAFT_117376 [Gelatoporia subvermispora B]